MFDIIKIGLTLFGTFGLIGTVCLIIFGPMLIPVVGSLILKIFNNRVGFLLLGLALGGAAGLWVGDDYGRGIERTRCDARERAADEGAKRRDTEQGQIADQDAQTRIQELETQSKTDKEQLDAYEKLIQGRQSNSCLLTPDDVKRR